jgi:NADP-dependent 3-hydroxy acid dehydrogenase YdfG
LGGIDILISDAGLGAETIGDMTYEQQDYVVHTNMLGYMIAAHEAIKRMKPKGEGHIVFVGSISAETREPGSSVYVATKSGIQGFAEALRQEINPLGIRVSLVEPGEVGTNMNELSPQQQRQKQDKLKQLKAEDIADCIVYVLTRCKRVDVIEIKVRPHQQLI